MKKHVVKSGYALMLLLSVVAGALGQRAPQDNWVFEPDIQWGEQGSGAGQFLHPSDIASDGEHIFVTDTDNHRIQVLTGQGSFVTNWGVQGNDPGQLNAPRSIAVDEQLVYLLEPGKSQVQAFTKSGNFVTNWGSSGSALGQFNDPSGIAVDRHNVFVADRGNNRIQVFTKLGSFVRTWGEHGSVLGRFSNPRDIAVGPEFVYVADDYDGYPSHLFVRMQIFRKDGSFVRFWPMPNACHDVQGIATDGRFVYVTFYQATNKHRYGEIVFDRFGAVQWQRIVDYGKTDFGDRRGIVVHSPFILFVQGRFSHIYGMRQFYRTLGSRVPDGIPLANVISARQRAGMSILDIDYVANDRDDTNVTVYVGALTSDPGAAASLEDFIPLRSFVDGTAGNVGPGVVPGQTYRISWDMAADGITEKVSDFGDLNLSCMVNDGRALLDLHFLSIPAMNGNPPFEINRAPLFESDFLPVWFWLLASGDTDLNLVTGQVYGVSAPYAGQTLAYDTNTTAIGRAFLFEKLSLREATSDEVQAAREASTPGSVSTWDPRREPPPLGYKVNEFNFVTDPTNGWWVVQPGP